MSEEYEKLKDQVGELKTELKQLNEALTRAFELIRQRLATLDREIERIADQSR